MPTFEIKLSSGDVLTVEAEEEQVTGLLGGSNPQQVKANDGEVWINPAQIALVREVPELDPGAYRVEIF